MTIGERIRHYRTERGWSIKELSEKSGINPSHLYRMEKGKKTPSEETLIKLNRALDVSIDCLLDTAGEYALHDLDLSIGEKVRMKRGNKTGREFIGDRWIARSSLQRIEKDEFKNLYAPTLIDLCAMTGMSVDWLLGIRRK